VSAKMGFPQFPQACRSGASGKADYASNTLRRSGVGVITWPTPYEWHVCIGACGQPEDSNWPPRGPRM